MNRRTRPATSLAPRTFVVRIYRRTPRSMTGQLQDVLTGAVASFDSPDELWRALGGAPSRPRR